jgi:hypothetical protein
LLAVSVLEHQAARGEGVRLRRRRLAVKAIGTVEDAQIVEQNEHHI